MPAFRPRGLMENRRETVRRIDAMTVKSTRVTGKVLTLGPGEGSVDVSFAVNFAERPTFTFGAELDDNHRAVAGRYPTVSAVVVGWNVVKEIEGATEGYYTGATLAVVSGGQADHKLWVHYCFEGKALSNPLTGVEGVDDAI